MNQVIPLTNDQAQQATVQLTVDDAARTLTLNINYLAMAGYWVMAVVDAAGTLLLSGVPLLTGSYPAANLLAQYQYMQIGSAYLLNTGSGLIDSPGQTTLDQFTLVWGDSV